VTIPTPLVSVVIPTYNRATMVERAVRSALAQDYEALEVVVVDDGSSDDTAARLAVFGDRVRLVCHPVNRGASAARNTGIEAARGEYVALLDSDDLWAPDKTRRQLQFMAERGLDMSCTGFRSVYGQGLPPVSKPRPYTERMGLEDLAWGIYVAPGTTLIARRDVLVGIGGYDTSLPRLEDWELLLRAVRATGELGFLADELAILHPSPGATPQTLLDSAGMLLDRGLHVLASESPATARKFRAGVAFEMAAALWKANARARSIGWLARSLVLAPVGHQSLRIILLPWLRARLRGERPDG
jgi:GT2 family glycosyltransferase